jgi:hypothetical protein
VSITKNYCVSPHEDDAAYQGNETIQFFNPGGELGEPTGAFCVGGHVHPLPHKQDQTTVFIVKGQGVW